MIKTDIKVFKTNYQPSHPPATFPFARATFPGLNAKIIHLSQKPQLESFGTKFCHNTSKQQQSNQAQNGSLNQQFPESTLY